MGSFRAYDPTLPWLPNAESSHGTRAFHAIIALGNPRQHPLVLTPSSLDDESPPFKVPREARVLRSGRDFARPAAPLIHVSRSLLIVEPYFDATVPSWRILIESLLDVVQQRPGQVTRIELHLLDHRSPAIDKLADCVTHLPPSIPMGLPMTVIHWKQKPGGEVFHGRFLLTDRGGIRFEAGMDTRRSPETTDVALVAHEVYELRWRDFQPATPAYDLIDSRVLTGTRRRIR